MKILYLDPYTEEEGLVKKLDSKNEYYFTNYSDVSKIPNADCIDVVSVFVNHKANAEFLSHFPNLKLVVGRSTGYDHIDLEACANRNIRVSNVPRYGSATVAEYTIALLFALSKKAYRSYIDLQTNLQDAVIEKYEGFELKGKTLGVIGTGAIGKHVCEIALGIGMNILAFDTYPDSNLSSKQKVTYKPLDDLLSESDVVTIHLPLLPSTTHLLDEAKLRKMKRGSLLINTARGGIIETKSLVALLKDGHIAGAALDVLEGENDLKFESQLLKQTSPDLNVWQNLVANHALIDMPNVIVTPHIAFNTVEAKNEITTTTINNILAFAEGKPINLATN